MPEASLLEAIASLEHFREKSMAILDHLESAASAESTRLAGIEERLRNCTTKLEGLRGSSQPLTIKSASALGTEDKAGTFARAVEPSSLNSMGYAINLPEASVPSFGQAANDLAGTARYTSASETLGQRDAYDRVGPKPNNLSSVSDLILFNSDLKPYENYRPFDNLRAVMDAQKDAASLNAPWRRPEVAAPNLLEDLPDALPEDLRFVPNKPAEVTLDLPDVLPDLGRVADLTWRQEDTQAEAQPIAWDAWATPAALPTVDIEGNAPGAKPPLEDQPFQQPFQQPSSPPRPAATTQPSASSQKSPAPDPPVKPQGPPAPAPAPAVAQAADGGKGKGAPPPPGKDGGKSKGKGPAKGPPAPKKAPPPPGKGKGKAPPAKKEPGAPGKAAPDVGALLASIRGGPERALKKVETVDKSKPRV